MLWRISADDEFREGIMACRVVPSADYEKTVKQFAKKWPAELSGR